MAEHREESPAELLRRFGLGEEDAAAWRASRWRHWATSTPMESS